MKKFYALLPFLGLFLIACEDDTPIVETPEPTPEYTAGSADFSKYVAVGSSLTAGYSDNALFIAGQEASFPNMLASNFALVGGGDFSIPFMADNLGGMTLGGNQITDNRLILSFLGESPAPVPVSGTPTTEVSNKLSGPFNNMGVPGTKSYELLAPGYGSVAGVAMGTANPYFARFSSSESTRIVDDAASQGATFFTLWAGSNDILLYAVGGGTGVNQEGNPDATTYAREDITDPTLFAGAINGVLGAMTANGAKGVIANLPNLTDLPYFTTVPHNPIPLDEATAAYLNSMEAYGAYNAGLMQLQGLGLISEEEVAKRTISFSAGEGNAVVILDEDLTDLSAYGLDNMRQATADDLLVLTASSFIGTLADPNNPASVNGVGVPLADQWILTPEEQAIVETALNTFNQTIAGLATSYDLAFVDANALLSNLNTNGVQLSDGSVVTAEFATGGGFSLDGVHPAPRGYAIVANAFIDAINAKYNSNLPGVNPLDYTGLYID
ncbi:MAG: G-D-S-L family lipolytic protein [Bacteroidota bacterium]|uniref:G-D-S-L family lipolytic protein n=1 Tax=Flagellimonas profundi TaxID=2915620 RepID=A0ABS3FIR1_9FLAO|nr:G-D-S-L family lipolytic protein [Allomuricauda profundi]MBO0342987.1 G-D-S-L family lipolytic protein [Allomuricauda profundi]MEC7772598.1 G-D-S-L family lipolytic protein [Bacteroidota bacterium]